MQPTEPASSAKSVFGPATAVLELAVSGRWRAPETTVALADHAAAQARAESDTATALLAEGWLIHGLSVLGRGVTGVSRALAATSEAARSGNRHAEARLRVGLASVARQLGDTDSARALLAPVVERDIADLELAADAYIEAVRCGGDASADGMLAAVDLATGCIHRLRGEQVELGLAALDAALANRHRLSGRGRAAAARARDGLGRVLGQGAASRELDPISPHIAAWLSLELTLALLDDSRPDLARRVAEPALAWAGRPAALVPLTRLRLVLAHRAYLPSGEHDVALRAVSWAVGLLAKQDLPELEADCQSLLAEVHERRGALADALAASRKAQEGLRLHSARVEQALVLLGRASGASGAPPSTATAGISPTSPAAPPGTSSSSAGPSAGTALSSSATLRLPAVSLSPATGASAGQALSWMPKSPEHVESASAARAGAGGFPTASDADDPRALKGRPDRSDPTAARLAPLGEGSQPVGGPDRRPGADPSGRPDTGPASIGPDAPPRANSAETTRAFSTVGPAESTGSVERPSPTDALDSLTELEARFPAGPDIGSPPSLHDAEAAAPRGRYRGEAPHGPDELHGPADAVRADPLDADGPAAGDAGAQDSGMAASAESPDAAVLGYSDIHTLDEPGAPDELSELDDISQLIDPGEGRALGLVAIDVTTPTGAPVGAFARPLLGRVAEHVRGQLPPNARLRVLASDVVLVVLPPVESTVVSRWMRSVASGLSARWAEYAVDVPRSAFRFAVGALDVDRSPEENVEELCARLDAVPPRPSAGITPLPVGGRHVARDRPAAHVLNSSDRTPIERGSGGRRRRPDAGVDGVGGAEGSTTRSNDARPSSGTSGGLDRGSSPNGRRSGIDRTALARLAELAWSPPTAAASRGAAHVEDASTRGPAEAAHGVDLLTQATEIEADVFDAGAQPDGAAVALHDTSTLNGAHQARNGTHDAINGTAGTSSGPTPADGIQPAGTHQQGARPMSELSLAELLAGALAAYRDG